MKVGEQFLHDLVAGHQFRLSLGLALRDVGRVHAILLIDCVATRNKQLGVVHSLYYQRLYSSQVGIRGLNMNFSGRKIGKRRKNQYELSYLMNCQVEQVYLEAFQFIMTDPFSAILQAKQINQTPTASTLVLHNPENSLSQCTDLNLNQDQELDSLPSNLDVHTYHIKTNSSEDYSQQEEEGFEVYRPKVNFNRSTYFHSVDSQLSQIKECNNQSSSIIYHTVKKAAMVNMPDIVEERNQMNSGQKWRGTDSRDSIADEKESNGDAETAVESQIHYKQPVKKPWNINSKTIVVVYLLVFIAAALYAMFQPSQKNMKKGSNMREERKIKLVPTKGKKASKAK